MPSSKRHTIAALAAMALLSACGLPKSPDIRREMSQNIQRLGVRPFYPLREGPRIGQLLLADAGLAHPASGFEAWQSSHEWLSDAVVPQAEAARQQSAPMRTRFPRSDDGLGSQLRPTGDGVAFFRQPTSSTAGAKNSLMLSAFPGLTLASVDSFSLGGGLPQAFSNFLAGIGLRSTRYLRVEAEGTEVADMPLDDLLQAVGAACADPTTPLGNPTRGRLLVAHGVDQMWNNRALRIAAAGDAAERSRRSAVPFLPQIYLLRRIHYLRGVRYIVEDSNTTAAMLRAALSAPTAPGHTPPTINSVTVSSSGAPTGANNAAVGRNAEQDARLAAIARELEDMRSKLATGSGAQVAATIARSTARGVELVDVFDRPLAFGYEPFGWNVAVGPDRAQPQVTTGFERVCSEAVAPPR